MQPCEPQWEPDAALWPTAGNQMRHRSPRQEIRCGTVAHSRESDAAPRPTAGPDAALWATVGYKMPNYGPQREVGAVL
jgi:hypothetical protein